MTMKFLARMFDAVLAPGKNPDFDQANPAFIQNTSMAVNEHPDGVETHAKITCGAAAFTKLVDHA
jgi:hypothetical protein